MKRHSLANSNLRSPNRFPAPSFLFPFLKKRPISAHLSVFTGLSIHYARVRSLILIIINLQCRRVDIYEWGSSGVQTFSTTAAASDERQDGEG